MLGLRKNKASWNWVAHGKHPCARDYMAVGQEDALSQAFAGWVEKGYELLDLEAKKEDPTRSWRFWTRTPREDMVIVGLVRDSCDAIGRPYPLMLMGSGLVPEFHKRWHLFPYACDRIWTQMEQLASRNYHDVSRFGQELMTIRSPHLDWERYERELANILSQVEGKDFLDNMKASFTSVAHDKEFFTILNPNASQGLFAMIILWHAAVRAHIAGAPSAVFMGGTPGNIYLAVFLRPLSPADFVTLWSANKEKGN